MKSGGSLTRRLILTLTAGAVVLWVLASLASISVLRGRLDDAFDGGLREAAERLLPLLFEGRGEHDEHDESHEVPYFEDRPGEYIVYQARGADGTLLLRSHDAPEAGFAAPLENGFVTAGPWRVYTLGTPDGTLFLQVAEETAHRDNSLRESAVALLLPIALFIPLSALGIFFAVRAGLRPVRQFSAEIELRQAHNLSPVVQDRLPNEIRPVAEAVNGLLARLRSAIEAERSLAANSAHELRTPLAASLAQTQRLVAELAGHPAEGRARQVEASLSRLRHVSEKLLQLSRADAGFGQAAEVADLMPALRVVVTDAQRQGDGAGRVVLDEGGQSSLIARMDIDAFGIALRNLIENGLRHGTAGTKVEVRVSEGQVAVVNQSPVVAPETLRELTLRFVRGGSSADGSGLGLAIVEAIMQQAGGALELLSPAPGRADGFEARLILPRA